MILHPSPDPVRYFAAANTANGFYNGFGTLLTYYAPDRLFLLKGGPGCGKSTLMKRAAAIAAERGVPTYVYHCSSDPSSLDAVFLPSKGIGILDATAPHALEPRIPGCLDETVDLGQAWNVEKLRERADDIRKVFDAKKRAYASAYRCLAAAGRLREEASDRLSECIDREKLTAAAARLADKCAVRAPSDPSLPPKLFVSAFGTAGRTRLYTPERTASRRIFLKDAHHVSAAYLDALQKALDAKAQPYTVFCDALDPNRAEGLYLTAAKVSITPYDETIVRAFDKAGEAYHVENMNRFLKADGVRGCRTYCRFAEGCEKQLAEQAVCHLRAAGEAHARLETLYGAATDFAAVEKLGTDRVLSVIQKACS